MNWAQAILDDETMFPNKIGMKRADKLSLEGGADAA
jgi:hypothetical protein